MRSAERRKINVLEIKCLRCLVGVTGTDRVKNEELRRRAIMVWTHGGEIWLGGWCEVALWSRGMTVGLHNNTRRTGCM